MGDRYPKLIDAIEACARALIEFVYDTIERSRRRSLREMYLVASTSTTDSEIRQRVLDYLTEGDIAPILERLVEQRTFRFAPWQDEMAKIASATDAHERRGTTARLLASYPDHPGLLAGRALAEAFDPDGDLRQLESSLDAAVVAARERYGGADGEAADFLAWVARRFEHSRRSVGGRRCRGCVRTSRVRAGPIGGAPSRRVQRTDRSWARPAAPGG